MNSYSVDKSESFAKIVNVKGRTDDRTAKRNVETVISTKTVIAPICGCRG